LGFRIGQSSGECDVAISLYPADWPFAIFKVLTGEHLIGFEQRNGIDQVWRLIIPV
jgi:hypothetical protein